jgi:hypothetical protein
MILVVAEKSVVSIGGLLLMFVKGAGAGAPFLFHSASQPTWRRRRQFINYSSHSSKRESVLSRCAGKKEHEEHEEQKNLGADSSVPDEAGMRQRCTCPGHLLFRRRFRLVPMTTALGEFVYFARDQSGRRLYTILLETGSPRS